MNYTFTKLMLVALFCLAPQTRAQNNADSYPFKGVITGTDVNIRSGAGTTYYVVTKLNPGDIVTVHDNVFGWLKVTPPEGVYSYIAKQYVKVDDAGKTGTLTGNRVSVRAPSKVGKSYKVQLYLSTGDKVTILGEKDEYYKIVPPDDVRLFVKATLVKKATPEDIAKAAAKNAAQNATDATDNTKTPDKPEPKETDSTKKPADTSTTDKPADTTDKPADTSTTDKPADNNKPDKNMKEDTTDKPADTTTTDKPADNTTTDKPADTTTTDKPADKPGTQLKPIEPKLPVATTEELIVIVLKDGSVKYGKDSVTAAELEALFTKHAKEKPNIRLLFQADKDTPLKNVTDVVAIAQKAGIQNLAFNMPRDVTEATENQQWDKLTASQQFEILARRLKAISKRPVAEMSLDDLETKYRAVFESGKLSDTQQALAEAHLKIIGIHRERQQLLEEVAQAQKEVQAQKKRMEDEKNARPKEYTALGRLLSSTVYDGRKLPLMFRLVDPQNNVTTAYIRPSKDIPIKGLLGQYVGIVGKSQYDAALKLNIITPEIVDPLKPRP